MSLINPESESSRLQRRARVPNELAWVNGSARLVHRTSRIGSMGTNAQVLPKPLTLSLLETAKIRVGTQVVTGRVENVRSSGTGWQVSVRHPNGELQAEQYGVVVLCMGPWTIQAQQWFPSLPAVMAQKAASLVVKTKVPATALFSEYVNSRSEVRSPEAYPREDEIYMCQSAVPEDLPSDPATIEIASRDVADLKEFGAAISSQVADAMKDDTNVVSQACNLPVSPDGLPLIGSIPDSNGTAFVAAGHSCWGILNSPATGKAIAEMILSGKSSINIAPFDPARFR